MMVKRPNVSAATAGPHESRFFTWRTLQRRSFPVASHYKRWLLSGCSLPLQATKNSSNRAVSGSLGTSPWGPVPNSGSPGINLRESAAIRAARALE